MKSNKYLYVIAHFQVSMTEVLEVPVLLKSYRYLYVFADYIESLRPSFLVGASEISVSDLLEADICLN